MWMLGLPPIRKGHLVEQKGPGGVVSTMAVTAQLLPFDPSQEERRTDEIPH